VAFNAGDIEATLTLDRTPFNEGLAKARAEAEKFEKNGIKLKVDVDKSFTSQIQRAINETQKSTGKGIRLPISVDDKMINDIRRKIDDIADNTELTAKRSGNRVARGLLNPLVIQLGLLPAVAMASVGAAGLALGALPLVFAGIGVAALKSNETLAQSYSQLWQGIKTDAADIAEPLIGTFTDVAHRIQASWRTLRPDLAQIFKDIDPLVQSLADGVLGFAEEAIPKFQQAISLAGPTVRGLGSLLKSVGSGLGDLAVNASTASLDIGRSLEITGDMLDSLLGTVGTLIAEFGHFWADVGPQFSRVFDKMLSAVELFTEGGLRGLGQGMNVTLGIVEQLLNVLGPFADIFGQVGGYALAAVGSLKILTGVVGGLGKVWGLLSPAGVTEKLKGVSGTINKLSTSFGEYVAIATNSVMAGDRAETAIRKIGNAAVKTIAWLPVLGTALAAGQAAIDHFWPSADTLADKMQQGGAAAAEARDQMIDYGNSVNTSNLWATAFASTTEDVNAAIKQQQAGMTEVERVQQRVTKAQNDYQYAVDKYGENSHQAKSAQLDLAAATDDLAHAQDRAAAATEDHTDAVIRQTAQLLAAVGSRLSYQQALLSMEQAQKDLTTAVQEHGAGSLEARQADIAYQQSILSVVNSLGERVKAEQASKGEAEAARLATAAEHQEIARLAVEAGTNLPPALAEMAAKLTDAELAAMGVTREVDGTGNAIYRLPPGKNLNFPSNAPVATSQVQALAGAIDHVATSHWTTFFLDYVTRGNPPPDTSGPANSGGLLGSSSGGRRAMGGPVKKGQSYWVGEQGIPELFFPDRDGFVLNGRDSRKLADSVRKGGDGPSPADLPRGGDGASLDYEALGAAVAAALADTLEGAKLEVDGNGLARIVNRTNNRNGAR
jgi:hypothetical protein